MSKAIPIGKSEDGDVRIDVARLVVSRLLLTAASGGGKSYLLRKILEGLSKTTQTIVVDTEGEFATLREARDMVLVGPGGEVPADPRSAGLLCRRLMELNLSAVLDVSELAPKHKRAFVANFVNTMIELPRGLWRPCFVAVDEIHEFAEEGESSESGDALSLLASKGRKRGYSLLGATQRLKKLAKDVAAELKNRLIGQTILDVDLRRAADILGFAKDRWPELRDLSPPGSEGEFFGVGPAFNHRGVFKFRGGAVETTHPKAGQGRLAEPPAASDKIRGVLGELKDLPQEAEAEIRDLATAKQKIAALERDLKAARATPKGEATPEQLRDARHQARASAATIAQLRKGLQDAMKVITDMTNKTHEDGQIDKELVTKAVQAAVEQIARASAHQAAGRERAFADVRRRAVRLLGELQKLLDEDPAPKIAQANGHPVVASGAPAPARPAVSMAPVTAAASDPDGRAALAPVERKVLDAVASFPQGVTRRRISIFSGVSIKSSSFDAALAGGEGKEGKRPSLVQAGLVRRDGELFFVTDQGAALASPTIGTTLADWMRKLRPSEAKILEFLAKNRGRRFTRKEVSEGTGQSAASSSFDASFPALRDLGLIEGQADFAVVEDLALLSDV